MDHIHAVGGLQLQLTFSELPVSARIESMDCSNRILTHCSLDNSQSPFPLRELPDDLGNDPRRDLEFLMFPFSQSSPLYPGHRPGIPVRQPC